jgi:hypothetical protein
LRIASISSKRTRTPQNTPVDSNSAVSNSDSNDQVIPDAEPVNKPKVPPGTVIISGKTNETINLYDADFSRSDFNGQLLVQNCTGCIINV